MVCMPNIPVGHAASLLPGRSSGAGTEACSWWSIFAARHPRGLLQKLCEAALVRFPRRLFSNPMNRDRYKRHAFSHMAVFLEVFDRPVVRRQQKGNNWFKRDSI